MEIKALLNLRTHIRLWLVSVGILALGLCLFPLVAWAADAPATAEPQQQVWQAVLAPVLPALGLVLAAVVTGALRKLALSVEKKFNVDIPDTLEESMARQARRLIAAAEEKAEKRLLYGDKQKTPGAEKAALVVQELEAYADRLGYGALWRKERIENLVEGTLHLERDIVIGSTNNPDRSKALAAAVTNG